MPNIATLLEQFHSDGYFDRIMRNPLAQFGTRSRYYVGATLLPEQNAPSNRYVEEYIRYRTIIAGDGTRFSPAQRRGGDLVGEMKVDLADSDLLRDMTSQDYEALQRYLQSNSDMEAMATLTNWVDTTVNLGLVELVEKQRWQALINAQVVRVGDGVSENINYTDPAGHRVTVAGPWSNDANDPFEDIHTSAILLADKGYTVNRIVTSRNVVSIMAGNDNVKARTGVSVVSPTGQIMGASGHASLEAINMALSKDGLPPIEIYDLQYRTETGTAPFMPAGSMLLACTTGRDATIDLGDDENLHLPDTLGYAAIGFAAGQGSQGRVIHMEHKMNKPPRLVAEGWQTTLPVITDPEAMAALKGIS